MRIISNNPDDKVNDKNELLWFLMRTAAGIILLAGAAWASWVSTTIFKYADIIADINSKLSRIEQKLTDHFEKDHAGH